MIGRLRGPVVERGLDGTCVLEAAGVGYEVFVPLGSVGRLPAPPAEVVLHVHTHVREDALVLYGFPTSADRDAFRTVLGVSGVGPKSALAILSALSADALAAAVAAGDGKVFKGIPGVGKKTIDRLLLELHDKVGLLASRGAAPAAGQPPRAAPRPTGPLAIVASALVQMGYKQAQAEQAVALVEAPDGRPAQELLREALRHLA